jgi:hypothetical protein
VIGAQLLNRLEASFSRFAQRRVLSLCVLFLAVVAVRLVILPFLPVPTPGIHDEASYLLMGDTFAHGRLANPPHPMWMSFETFHVNWFPTYSSMYPPAQGFALAIGQLLGHPWIGVLLSTAAMCAAIAWMLQAWMPARWSLVGGMISALKFGVASYWVNSYWGGSVAALGGALVLGALPRLFRRPTVWHSVILGVGAAILANSRPYEGFLFCLPAFAWLLWKLAKSRIPRSSKALTFVPAAVVLLSTAIFMGYYNWRLTGDALLFPHVLRYRTYHSSGIFLWQHLRPPLHYNNPQFNDFYNGWERENYDGSWPDIRRVTIEKTFRYLGNFLWWGALLLLPGFVLALRDKKMRLLTITFLVGCAALFALVWSLPHYVAPYTCVIVALTTQALRHLRTTGQSNFRIGRLLATTVMVTLLMQTGSAVIGHRCDPMGWTCAGNPRRAALQRELSAQPGKHLVLVRYSSDHPVHSEWVFNGADLENAKVLWARELDQQQNTKLISYFHDRQVWLVEPDDPEVKAGPYVPPSK